MRFFPPISIFDFNFRYSSPSHPKDLLSFFGSIKDD